MGNNNRTTTFTINIDSDITGLLKGTEQVKKAIGSIFNSSNLGQSLLGDFNKLNKILTRIQNTASGPIRSEWGAENLIADFSRAGVKVDDIISKLEEIKKDKDLRIDILPDNEIKDLNKVLEYSKKLGAQLEKNEKTEQQIADLKAKEAEATANVAKAEAELNSARKRQQTAQGQLTRLRNKTGLNDYTKDQFEKEWRGALNNLLTKGGDFNAAARGAGLSKSLLNGADLIDIKSIMSGLKGAKYKDKDSGKELEYTKNQLEEIEKKLNEVNEKKKIFLSFEDKKSAFSAAEKEVEKLTNEFDGLKTKV